MQMTKEEIVRDYNVAANKSKQIKVLADLNCVSPGEIRAVLAQAGVPGVKMPERIRRQKVDPAPEPEQKPEGAVPVPACPAVYDRIESILAVLPEDASETVRRSAADLLCGMLEEYLAARLRLGGESV